MSNYYVTKNNNGWNVRKEKAQRVSGRFTTKIEAERIAKKFLHNTGGGEVRIQGRDGKFRDSDTVKPARDPFPPRDKKH